MTQEQQTSPTPPPGLPPPSLAWMRVDTEWGVRAGPDLEQGLTLGRINVGSYGAVPDIWENETMLPRGAAPIAGVESMGYSIYRKADVWAESCAEMYEEAIRERWAPATDVPWDTLAPLPEDIEAAMCQLCTELAERAYWSSAAVGTWLKEISYGFIEVKAFLSTEIFDRARHTEAFRKRALANGGGPGVQPTSDALRGLFDARAWRELSVRLHILQDSFTATIYRWGRDRIARNDAERTIFDLALRDTRRHVRYGRERLAYQLAQEPQRRAELHTYLHRGENAVAHDDLHSSLRGALAVLLGGGTDGLADGVRAVEELRCEQVRDYLAALEEAGLGDRRERLHPKMRPYA